MLTLTNIDAHYSKVQVLRELSLEVRPGEILCLLGRNGAGKTTTLKTIMGLVPVTSGTMTLNDADITDITPHLVPKLGIGYIPQGRRLFTEMTVAENLNIGLMAGGKGPDTREHVLTMFPVLKDRLNQRADTLSGGEQQMLATARALCLEPTVLLLDEPTEGLQPSMISLIRDAMVELKNRGVAIVLVEQRVDAVLEAADRITFIENGRNALTVTPNELREDKDLLHRYVGV